MAVLKGNAYGHYAPVVFRHLLETGIRFFAVANIREALQLRAIDSSAPILIFGNVHPRFIPTAIENKLSLTVFSLEFWNALKPFLTSPLTVHIKLNTGLNRLGFSCDRESVGIIKEICTHPMIRCEGIYTHFAHASPAEDMAQFERFTSMVSALEAEGLSFPFKHIADSAAALAYPWSLLDLARLGDLVYGLKHDKPGFDKIDLRGALKLKSSVSQVRDVRKGEGVSYNYAYRAPDDIRTATLAFGYSDGYPRRLGNGKGFVIIRGQKAPILGNVCMDLCIVDVSNIPGVQMNDEALLFDTDEASPVSAAMLADLAGINRVSLLTSISPRVPRVFIKDGRRIAVDILNGTTKEI
jgi:alanine racemase